MSPTWRPWYGCHSNGRCLSAAHWTFSSYGRLEAERVNQFWWNLVCCRIPNCNAQIAQCKFGTKMTVTWPILIFLNTRWRTSAMLENIGNAIAGLPMYRFKWNLGGHIPLCPRHVRRDAVAMATAATAHWTFSSYGRLEAGCVNQFRWNLMYNSIFESLWQSRDQILNC